MENGEWRMENGEWRMENGEWRMENGRSKFSTYVQELLKRIANRIYGGIEELRS